jgi:hypothetical protein
VYLQKVIDESTRIILENDQNNGITGLYIGGTIKEEDRTNDSDIDYIGIVNSQFKDNDEKMINEILKKTCAQLGTAVKIRVLYESELAGGKQKGFITKLIPIKIWIKRIPHFVHVWGEKLNLAETIGSYSHAEEAENQIRIINGYIAKWRRDEDTFHFDWIPKAIMYLCSAEAEAEYGRKYTISFSDLLEEFGGMEDHIMHESIFHRRYFKETDKEQKEIYLRQVSIYLKEIEQKSKKWK